MNFFVVPTVAFRLLYVGFVIDHGRRRIIHFNMTTNPTATWVSQQLREAFPNDSAPHYLIFDNDSIFSDEVSRSINALGIMPKRTAFRSPWQNGTAERWVGTCKRELIDHVVVLGEDHLRRLLRDYDTYVTYVTCVTYDTHDNADRVHTRLADSPDGRPVEARPSFNAKLAGLPRVGGLHHRYVWQEAA
jgi:transposase InsO family protein